MSMEVKMAALITALHLLVVTLLMPAQIMLAQITSAQKPAPLAYVSNERDGTISVIDTG